MKPSRDCAGTITGIPPTLWILYGLYLAFCSGTMKTGSGEGAGLSNLGLKFSLLARDGGEGSSLGASL